MDNLNHEGDNNLEILKSCFSLDFLGIHKERTYQKLENLLQSIPSNEVHEIMTDSLGSLPEWFVTDSKPHCCPIQVLFFIVNRVSTSITVGDRLREFDFLFGKLVEHLSFPNSVIPLGLNEFSLLFLRHEELRVQYLLAYCQSYNIMTVWNDKMSQLYNLVFDYYIADINFPILFTQMFYNGMMLDPNIISHLYLFHPHLLHLVSQPCISRFHFTDSSGVERTASNSVVHLSSLILQCHENYISRNYDLIQSLPPRPSIDHSLFGIAFSPQYPQPDFTIDLVDYPYYNIDSHVFTKLNITNLFKPILTCFGDICSLIVQNLSPNELDDLPSLIPQLFPLLAIELTHHQYHNARYIYHFNLSQVRTPLLDFVAPFFQSQPSPKFMLGLDVFIVQNFYRLDSEAHLYGIYDRKPLAQVLHNLPANEPHVYEYDAMMSYMSELMCLVPVIDTFVLMKCVLLVQKHTITNKNRLCAAIYDDLYSIVEKHQEKIYDSAAFLFLLNHTPSAMSLYTPENLSRWESVYLDVFVNRKKNKAYPNIDFYTRLLVDCVVHQQVELIDRLFEGYLSEDPQYKSFKLDSKTFTIAFNMLHTLLTTNGQFLSLYNNQEKRMDSVSERYMYELYDIREIIFETINYRDYSQKLNKGAEYPLVLHKYSQVILDILVKMIDFSEKSHITLNYLPNFSHTELYRTNFSDYLELPIHYPTWTPQTSVVEMLSLSSATNRTEHYNESTIYIDLLLKVGDRQNEVDKLTKECLQTSFVKGFCVGHIGLLSLWKRHHNTVLCFQKEDIDPDLSVNDNSNDNSNSNSDTDSDDDEDSSDDDSSDEDVTDDGVSETDDVNSEVNSDRSATSNLTSPIDSEESSNNVDTSSITSDLSETTNPSPKSYRTILHMLMSTDIQDIEIPDECHFTKLIESLCSLFNDDINIEIVDL